VTGSADDPDPGSRIPSLDVSVAYEIAREILSLLIGYAACQIDAEKSRSSPDQVIVDSWLERRDAWAARWRRLRPTDIEDIQIVLDRDGATLRSLKN
jgi:hypothetical protein